MSFGESLGQDSEEAPTEQVETTPQENSPVEQAPAEAPPSDGHPAWAPVKEALGEFGYHKITPYLKEFDDAANKRITEVNSKYEPWKQFADQGVTPDMVSQAFTSLQTIQQDPVAFYERLAEHLRSQGLLQEAEQAQAEADSYEDLDADPRDKQIAELREQNEKILAWQEAQLAEQEQSRLNQQAEQSLQQEMGALQQAGVSQEDMKVVLQRAHLYARADIDKSLQEVFDEIQSERSSILTRPRPNDTAPRLPGVGGSAPTGNPAKRPEDFSRQESQAYLADLLRKENQQAG